MQIQSQYSYSSSARKILQQVVQSISNEAYTKKGLSDEYKETLQKANTSRRSKYREGRSTKRAQVVEEDIKEVIGLGKENDEATVVLETEQTKNYRAIFATKTWTAGIYCKINYLLCNIFIFNV